MTNAEIPLILTNILSLIGFFVMWGVASDRQKGMDFWADCYFKHSEEASSEKDVA